MKRYLLIFALGFFIYAGMRTVHSILCNHYLNQCLQENKDVEFDPVKCMDDKMGNLNFISTVSGFPMYFFNRWEWHG